MESVQRYWHAVRTVVFLLLLLLLTQSMTSAWSVPAGDGQYVESSISLTAARAVIAATRRRFQSPLRLFNYRRSAARRPSDYPRSAGPGSDRHSASPSLHSSTGDGTGRPRRPAGPRTESLERRQFLADSVRWERQWCCDTVGLTTAIVALLSCTHGPLYLMSWLYYYQFWGILLTSG